MLPRSNLYQFFLLFSKCLCCLDIFAVFLPCTRLFQELGNVYFVFSYVFRYSGTKQVSQIKGVTFHTRCIHKKKKNVYEEVKVIVKIEAVFSLSLNQITEILSRRIPQMFCYCYHRQIYKQINCHQQNILHL